MRSKSRDVRHDGTLPAVGIRSGDRVIFWNIATSKNPVSLSAKASCNEPLHSPWWLSTKSKSPVAWGSISVRCPFSSRFSLRFDASLRVPNFDIPGVLRNFIAAHSIFCGVRDMGVGGHFFIATVVLGKRYGSTAMGNRVVRLSSHHVTE